MVFSIPQISIGQRGIADGLYQALSILIVFPIVILIGAGSNIKGKRSISLCKWLGDISFPLYITHYPLMYCQMGWATTHPNAPAWMHIVMNIGVIALSIAIGWACLKLYDEPVRKWLTNHWLNHKH
ncbi:MAG: acyltransferase family protein [Prevotella sp.]|nr:acyltransferase family protein [Prevotella sp.]